MVQENIELMNESFDFIDPNDEKFDENEQEVDPVSNVLLTRFTDAPIPPNSVKEWSKTSRILKFKLNPNGIDGVGFISQDPDSVKQIKCYPQEQLVYPSEIPTLNNSTIYTDYVSNLFSIYEALGEERNYNVQTIGLIKKDSSVRQNEVLNKAFDLIIKELEIYIERKQQEDSNSTVIFELEESLNILNCLKALYFSEPEHISLELNDWINKADPQPDYELTESIMKSDSPYKHPLFWKFIICLSIRGLFHNASEAIINSGFEELEMIDINQYNLFLDSINLLKSYPLNSSIEIFKQWKSTAAKASINASNYRDLRTFLNILSGNKSTILENSSNWYESIIGLFNFYIPSLDLLQEYYELSIANSQPDRSSIWESACSDIFEGNFLQVLNSISSFDQATSCYVSVLLEAKGLLRGYDNRTNSLDEDLFSTSNVSQYLIHLHALDCLSIQKLIPVGVGLLINSKNPIARSVIAEYLPHYDFKTNDDLEWALTICASLKLPTIAHVLFRIAAQRSLEQGLLFESLELFAKAGEIEFIKGKCWLIFENSLIENGPIKDQIINSIVDDSIKLDLEISTVHPILIQTLSPYAILYQFWKFHKEGALRSSLLKLISLLKFKYLPMKLFGVLISQILPFIAFQTPSNILIKQDLLALIKIIDNYENKLSQSDKKSLKQKIESEEFYKYYIDLDIEDNWVKQLKQNGIEAPKDLKDLIKLIRRSLSIEIGKSFMDEIYI